MRSNFSDVSIESGGKGVNINGGDQIALDCTSGIFLNCGKATSRTVAQAVKMPNPKAKSSKIILT
jgi:hypothetical protein